MFHINDLETMDDAQLRQTAESMQIKISSSASRMNLIDAILDHQAESSAKDFLQKNSEKKKTAKEKPARAKKQKKAEQEPKDKQNNIVNETVATVQTANTENGAEQPVPKKRGRKPKSTIPEIQNIPENPETTVVSPENNNMIKEPQPEASTRKKGRKSLQKSSSALDNDGEVSVEKPSEKSMSPAPEPSMTSVQENLQTEPYKPNSINEPAERSLTENALRLVTTPET